MKEIALISDLHFGVYRSHREFLKSQIDFFEKQFLPYLRENDIKDIYILGDIFDNRQTINVFIQNAVYDLFSKFEDFDVKILVGNHDSYFLNDISVNSVNIFKSFKNIEVIDTPKIEVVGNNTFLFLPWLLDHGFKQMVDDYKKPIDVCFGHLDIGGFYNWDENSQLRVNYFTERFKRTFSGHFHKRDIRYHNENSVAYIGCPYQLTRIDHNQPKGFCLLNVKDLSFRFIENEVSSKFIELEYPNKFNKKLVKNNIVNVHLFKEQFDEAEFIQYVKNIEKHEPMFAPKFFYKDNFENTNEQNLIFKNTSILDLFNEYVETLPINNKPKVLEKLETLYKQYRSF